MNKDDLMQIWENVQANQKRLEECPSHDFVDITPDKRLGKKYRCQHCSGEVRSEDLYWYEMGRKHGGALA